MFMNSYPDKIPVLSAGLDALIYFARNGMISYAPPSPPRLSLILWYSWLKCDHSRDWHDTNDMSSDNDFQRFCWNYMAILFVSTSSVCCQRLWCVLWTKPLTSLCAMWTPCSRDHTGSTPTQHSWSYGRDIWAIWWLQVRAMHPAPWGHHILVTRIFTGCDSSCCGSSTYFYSRPELKCVFKYRPLVWSLSRE